MKYRTALKDKKRIIVKIGTALLTLENKKINLMRLEKLSGVLSDLRAEGREIILVSSGAVGAGMGRLGLSEKVDSVVEKQALASIGQAALMRMYETFFNEHEQAIGQVLLTRDGVENSIRRKNAKNTISRLLEMGVIPIINENDTVSTAEIEFGDNDMLSAQVAGLVYADLLIILTNTDGLFTADPSTNSDAKKLNTVLDLDDLKGIDFDGKSQLGSGGMKSKIEAAELCRNKNIDVVIADGKDPSILTDVLEGKPTGTMFVSEATAGKVK